MIRNKFLRVLSFFIFPAFVWLFNIFITRGFHAYDVFPWIDIPMHFLGGFAVGYMFVLFLRFFDEENLMKIRSKAIFVLIVVSLTLLVAILWEFHEYILVHFFNFNWVVGYEDTLLDLLMGMLGSFVVGVFGRN